VNYSVDQTRVAADVATFSSDTLFYWNACLDEISVNPYPRFGYYIEQIVPIRGFPLRTFLYEITH
jgi:hypothetical protein